MMSASLESLFRGRFIVSFALVGLLVPALSSAVTPVQVATGGSQPAPSRDGAWIAIRSGSTIAKIRPDGSGMTTLVKGIDPNWNRAGDLIVFSDYSNRLFTVNATTAETTHVWTAPAGDRCDHPAWSPVADEISVSSPALTLVHYPYGPAAPVPCNCSDMQNTAWSPDGQKIVFDTGDIYTVPRTGGVPEPLVVGPLSQRFPSWSPDGRFIAFAQRDDSIDDYWHIWVVDARGESFGKTQLTEGPQRDQYPAWSPDGTTIYFDSNRGSGGIWKLPFDSTVPVRHETWGSLKLRYGPPTRR